jgi:hypothetical protein
VHKSGRFLQRKGMADPIAMIGENEPKTLGQLNDVASGAEQATGAGDATSRDERPATDGRKIRITWMSI